MTSAAAELRGVSKRYGQVTALDGVDMTLAPGQVTAILGPNGAGKTTAVRLILGLAQPTSGTVRLLGHDPLATAARQRVGVMLQVSKVPETLRVAEHVELFSSYYPSPLPASEIIEAAGLAGLEQRAFGKLSGGQRQRLLFALAICGNPDFLVLDEPTVGLDVEARRGFWVEMRRLVSRGRSLLLTTHYIEEAEALADRIVILQGGRIIADGSPADIKARVAGRSIRCVTNLSPAEMKTIPGVRGVRQEKQATVVVAAEVESVVRELLARDSSLAELEIARANLEDAFLELTIAEPARAASPEAR
jgi:ABC-2 type transport system ATP-binding protein